MLVAKSSWPSSILAIQHHMAIGLEGWLGDSFVWNMEPSLINYVFNRINRNPIEMDFIMQMRAGTASGITHFSNYLTPGNRFTPLFQIAIKMTISRHHAMAMVNYHDFA